MRKEIEILKERYGTYQEVATRLGITDRHLRNVVRNENVSKPLRRLIRSLVENLKPKQA